MNDQIWINQTIQIENLVITNKIITIMKEVQTKFKKFIMNEQDFHFRVKI